MEKPAQFRVETNNDYASSPVSAAQVRLTLLRQKRGVQVCATTIGVPTYALFRLVEDDLLPPTVVDMQNFDRLDGVSTPLVQDVMSRRSRNKMPENTYSLSRLVASLSLRLEQPWSAILRAAKIGAFEFWVQGGPNDSLLNSIKVAEVGLIRELMANAPVSDSELRPMYVLNPDAATTLGMPLAYIADYQRTGLLRSPATVGKLTWVRANYCVASHIQPRFLRSGQMSVLGIANELRYSGIRPLANGPLTLWDRASVDAYFGDRIASCICD